MMKTTGIFPGSFNPIHIGHLALANWLCEYEEVEEIWFLVTPQNPLKERGGLIDYALRFEMVKASLVGYPRCKASDFETTLPLPSYTFRTFRALSAEYPDRRFCLIIGADSWVNFDRWKESESLIREFPVWIYPRLGYNPVIPPGHPMVRIIQAPILEVSSSFIRQALREGKDVRFFLPEAIREKLKVIQS
jgi:nicotinate-nucleotide adenylyltransferase